MSNISGDEGSFSSGNNGEEVYDESKQQQVQNNLNDSSTGPSGACNSNGSTNQQQNKKKRNLPGTPDPSAEVVALSPTTLMATNRFVCEICNKGFQRDQNLQLHRRGHNLPWKLRQRTSAEVKKKVYVCPEPSCVHHNPARALGDLTGIKKHFSRKHGEKKWKCDKCSKRYAVQSDWKAHQKTCGTREYKCDCGTIFSRRDSFITHRAFCDALTEENNRVNQGLTSGMPPNLQNQMHDPISTMPLKSSSNTPSEINNEYDPKNSLRSPTQEHAPTSFRSTNNACGGMFSTSAGALFGGPKTLPPTSSTLQLNSNSNSFNYFNDSKNGGLVSGTAQMSATALLQKAAQMGATASNSGNSSMMQKSFVSSMVSPNHISGPMMMHHNHNQIQPSYEHFNPLQHDLSNMAGVSGGGAFTNQLFQKEQQEISLLFDNNTSVSTINNDIGMFSHGLMKNVTQEVSNCSNLMHGSDVATVHDFLGIGGSNSSLHEPQQQRLEALSQQRLEIMNNFHHHHLPHDDSAMEKSIWDV